MLTDVIRVFFLLMIPFVLVGFFILSVFIIMYSNYRSVMFIDSIPNTRKNNRLLSFSFYSIAAFLFAAGLTRISSIGNYTQVFWAFAGTTAFILFDIVLIRTRNRDLKRLKHERVPQNRFHILWKIPTNGDEKLGRLMSIIVVAVILCIVVLLGTLAR